MKNMVVINTPSLMLKGGVSSFYKSIKNLLPSNIIINEIGRDTYTSNILSRIKKIFLDYYKFYRLISNNAVDIFICNPSLGYSAIIRDALFCLVAKWQKKKCVVFWRGWNIANEVDIDAFWVLPFMKILLSANKSFVLNKYVKKQLIKRGYNGKIIIMTTVVSDKIAQNNKQVNFEKEPFCILFLSRVEKQKGIFELVEAYKLLKKKYPKLKLVIAGDGSVLSDIKNKIINEKIEGVQFTGYISGKSKLEVFNNSSCYALPSYSEGMPNSVLEAFMVGLPVIATPVGGLVDIWNQEKMGSFIKIKDVTSIYHAIELLLLNRKKCQKIGNYNKKLAIKNYIPKKVVNTLITEIKKDY